jgi:hypothetical protein
MTLSGGGASATLTGALAAAMIGTQFTYGTPGTTLSTASWVYALYPTTGTAATFQDAVTGFGFSMSPVATLGSYTNQYGVTVSMTLYRSDFIQTVGRTVKRVG